RTPWQGSRHSGPKRQPERCRHEDDESFALLGNISWTHSWHGGTPVHAWACPRSGTGPYLRSESALPNLTRTRFFLNAVCLGGEVSLVWVRTEAKRLPGRTSQAFCCSRRI